MAVHLLQVPYDSGHRAQRMGRGPLHLVERGAALRRLRRVGLDDVGVTSPFAQNCTLTSFRLILTFRSGSARGLWNGPAQTVQHRAMPSANDRL